MSGTATGADGSQNVAALGFAVDSSQVVTASNNLDQLQASSDKLAESQDNLTQKVQRFLAVANDMSESTTQMRRQFQDASQSLDGLISTLDRARTSLDGTAASFANLVTAQGQVTALGQSFGTTAAGLEAFSQQSAALGLSAQQTTLALQRITEALNNQTLAGQAVRQQIQGLGVDLANLTANDSAGVLATVVQKLRQYQGPGRDQTESSILGITDPGTLYQLNQAPITTSSQRLDMSRQMAANRQIAQTSEIVAGQQSQLARDNSDYSDLGSQYNVGWFSGLSSEQKAQLSAALGLPTADNFSSESSAVAAYRYLAANPNSDLANAARRPLASIGRYVDTGYLGNEFRHLTDGTYSSNQADIESDYDLRAEQSSFGPTLGRAINFLPAQFANIKNALNLYTPQAPTGTTPNQDPDTTIRQDQMAGQTLAGFGDNSLSNYQSIAAQIRRMQDSSVLPLYTRQYGAQEGQARYANTIAGLQQDQKTAMQTGGDQIQSLEQQQYLQGMPVGQQAEAQQLLQFMSTLSDQKGNIPRLWSGSKPFTLDDILNPNGTSDGPGTLTQQETEAFNKIRQLTVSNSQTATNAAYDQRMGDARQIDAASAISPADVQDVTAKIQAYNDAIKAGLNPATDMVQITQRQTQAENELLEKRKTAGDALIAQLDFSNNQASNVIAATAGAAPDAVSQGSARYSAGINNDYRAEVNSGHLADSPVMLAQYTAGQQRQLGLQALQFGQDQVTAAKQSYASAGTGYGPDAAEATRDANTYAAFADALAKARTAADGTTEALNSMITKVIALGKETADYQFEQRNFDQAVSGFQSAQTTRYIASLPADQRELAQQQQSVLLQPGTPNQVLDQHNPVSGDMSSMIQAAAGNTPGLQQLAETMARLEGATDHPDLLASDPQRAFGLTDGTLQQYGIAKPTDEASAISAEVQILKDLLAKFDGNAQLAGVAYGPAGPGGAQRFAASGFNVDALPPGGAQIEAQGLGYMTPEQRIANAKNSDGVSANLAGVSAQRDANTTLQIANAQSMAQPLQSIEQLLEKLLLAGDTGAAALLKAGVNQNPLNPQLGAAQAQIRVTQTQQGFNQQIASNAGATDQDIANNKLLGDAYLSGNDAVLRLNAALQANKEAQAENMTATQKSAREAQLYTDAISKQTIALDQLLKKNQDQITLNNQAASLPIMGSDQREATLAQQASDQQIDNQFAPGSAMNAQAKASQAALVSSQQLAQSAQATNQAFTEMGQTIFNTFEQASAGGQRFKTIMGEMLISIGQIIEKLLIEKPLENAVSNGMGSIFGTSVNGVSATASNPYGIFGGLANFFGFGSGAGAAAGATDWTDMASAAGVSAKGNVFGPSGLITMRATGGVFGSSGPIKMHATGSIVNSPTGFMDAGGGSNLMGEAGPEAVMPLTVLPNGSLGIQAAGGGGAQTIIMHTPIYVQGGAGGGGGGLDASTQKQLQRAINTMVEGAVKSNLLRQQKPGGMLYGTNQN